MDLRFILTNDTVSAIIPGMRKLRHNIATSDGNRLSNELLAKLRKRRWDRMPTAWSQ